MGWKQELDCPLSLSTWERPLINMNARKESGLSIKHLFLVQGRIESYSREFYGTGEDV
jgi:hypothetical protein